MFKVNRWIIGIILITAVVLAGTENTEAATLNVPGSYATIQDAIDNANAGDTVLVADGTYVESINFLGKAITVQSVNGAATTIIDGNALDSPVTFISGEGVDSVLDGFFLTNGAAGRPSGAGGIYCEASSPSIKNCTISNNSGIRGGGIACWDSSSPIITDCVITYNSSLYGAGIYCDTSSPTILNCTISNNDIGAGIYCYSSSPVISDCTISNNGESGIYCTDYSSPQISNCTISNNTGIKGGGIHCINFSSPQISNCTIKDNANDHMESGGIFSEGSSAPTITSCTIKGNYSYLNGGGISCWSGSATVINSEISGNTSFRDGGGVYLRHSSSYLLMVNSTMIGNTSEIGLGGGIYSYTSPATIVNSILWDNMASDVPDEIGFSKTNAIDVTYSVIEGSYIGVGNSKADPLFLNATTGNYRLLSGSPGIDSANSDAPAPATDRDGNARYDDPGTVNSGVGSSGDYYDRGAYEFVGVSCTDGDSDGYYVEVVCGGDEVDCDDTDPAINPGISEICGDGVDNNCDGLTDDGFLYFLDSDGDNYGDPSIYIEDCNIPSAVYVADNTDCNDADPAINPAAIEICDAVDNNCNYLIDESLNQSCGSDVGECQSGIQTCSGGSWGTCNGATGPWTEICDGLDNNCDGTVDEGCPVCSDADGDGYYAEAGCGTEVDCDDGNPDINPGACDIKRNGIDEDCDGSDRRGGPACPPPGGTDPEVCDDTIDNDGDGDVDCADADCSGDPACSGGDPEICDDSIDNDGDGDVDCDDSDCDGDPACGGGCTPSAEICDDGVDNDCDGKVDCADKKDCRRDPAC